MVFEARSFKRSEKLNKTRSKSADSGVSVALNKTFRGHNLQSSNSEINGIEEEQLDFEPEFENEYDDMYQNQSELDNSQCFRYNSNSPTSSHNYSTSDISVAHRRHMLPLPKSDAKDGRQNEYLPIYYPSSESARIIDSSSDDSVHSDSDKNIDIEIQDSFSRDHYSYESGNENEENSSTYSMTQEEEERLLGSSGEESQEGTFTVQPNLKETCRIGNACITLPKFVLNPSPFVNESQTNDLKRTKSTAKLRPLESETKKKKWDLSFTPEYPITQLFLDDIGYTPDEKISGTSTDDSHSSDSPFGSFRVICNKDKILCEETEGNIQSEILSKSEESSFKLPLPPPKRPPTRPKRTVFTGKASGTNLQIKLSNKDDRCMSRTETCTVTSSESCSENSQGNKTIVMDKEDDDGLSIIASTIGVDNIDEVLSTSNAEETDDFNAHRTYMEPQYSEDRVKQWVQNVPVSEMPSNNLYDKPFAGTDVSIAPAKRHTSPILPRGNNRINFRDIPSVFIGLCAFYYFTDNCPRPRCYLQHIIQRDTLIYRLQRQDPNDLYKIFEFAKGFDKLFKESYSAFIAAFGKLKMQNELIMCIKYFLQTDKYDATEAIECVIRALEDSGISFLDAIEMISFNIGFLEHPVLADILLDLITRKYNISENWEVIKRIAKARGKIKPATVTTMLERATAVYPLDKELCLDIYNMIIKNNMTDLSKISAKVLVPYRTLVGFEDAIGPLKPPLVKIHQPRIRPLTLPNQPELLAAQIDTNLIRERERFEREVEGTTVLMRTVPNKAVEPKVNYSIPNPNFSIPHSFPDSHSSDSDDRYFMPVPRHSPSPSRSPSNHKRDLYSYPPSSPSASGIDPNVALRFEPPPTEISEYVPENINTTREMPQEDEINLTPSRPIFGRSCYRSDFSFEKSLHNLLPDSFEHVNINEKDVATLNSVIKTSNGAEFYKLLQYYMNHPPTLENFITMTIVNLKSCGNNMCGTLNGLRRSLESIYPDYGTHKKIKAIFEVIVMNLLFVLEKKSRWKDALSLLELFCDWDSLVSSKIFSQRRVSHMGRYIFLAKIFANAKNFCFTYEILQNSNLNLLGPPNSWPYDHISTVDLECRNWVLMEFFKYAHHYYIIGVSDMYRRVYKYGGIFGFDAQSHFNPMLIAIMNDQQPSLLKYFFSDIDIYYTVMDKNVLRAFTILLAPQLSQENLFKLYEFCCDRQIYTKFMGGESGIIVRNNMFDVELQLILNYYFHKLTETRKIPIGNVAIQIKLMDKKPVYPKLLQTCVRSIKDINEKVKKIVKDNFSIVAPDKCNDQLTVIEILHEQIVKWLQCNQRWFPTYN